MLNVFTPALNPSPQGRGRFVRVRLTMPFLLLASFGTNISFAKASSHFDPCDQVIETEKGERIDISIVESPMLFGRYAASKYICGADIPVLVEVFPRAIEAGGCTEGTELYQDFHELASRFDQNPMGMLDELGLYNEGLADLKRGAELCENLNADIAEFLLEFSTINEKQ